MAFQLEEMQKRGLEALCKKYEVLELKLFGSAVRDDFGAENSDLDFLVTFGEPPVGMRLSTQYFGLLEELKLFFKRQVDLLEESAIENKYLKSSATESAITLYAA